MGAKYTTNTIASYNSSPPADDGTQVAANLVTWAKHKTKLGDPIKTLAEAINTSLVASSNYSARQITDSDSVVAGDHMRTVEIAPATSSACVVTLADAATMTSTFIVRIKNSSAYSCKITRATGGDTFEGATTDFTINPGVCVTLSTTAGADGYIVISEAIYRAAYAEDYAGVGDGVADDDTPLTNLYSSANDNDPIAISDHTFLTTLGVIGLRNKTEGVSGAILKCDKADATYDFTIAADRTIVRDVKLTGAGLQTLACNANIDNTTLDNVWVVNTKSGTPGRNGITINSASPTNYRLLNSIVDATGYAVTVNTSATGGTGLVVGHSWINSTNSDAVIINVPNATFTDTVINGNLLSNDNTGSGAGQGFNVDIAGGQNVAVVANALRESRLETMHIEDQYRTVAVVGNVAKSCYDDGIEALADPQGEARSLVVVGNNIGQFAGQSGKTGYLIETSTYPFTLTTLTSSGTTATATLVGINVQTGDSIVISGANEGDYNGTFSVTRVDADSFTYTMLADPVDTATGTILAKRAVSITSSGSTATATTTTAHGLYTGQGIVISGAVETEYNEKPVVTVTSSTTFTYTITGSPASPATGTPVFYANNRIPPMSVLVGNAGRDFDTGLYVSGHIQAADMNVVEEATTAVMSIGGAIVEGTNFGTYQVGAPAALVLMGQTGGVCGKIIVDKTPTAYITKTAGLMPGMLRGFAHPVAAHVQGAGLTDDVTLFTLPDLCKGRLICRARSGSTDFIYQSADIHWDGTTLTVSNGLRKNVGGLAGAAGFDESGGALRVKTFHASAVVVYIDIDFEGEWIVY